MSKDKTERPLTVQVDSLVGCQPCGACGNQQTVGIFRNEERNLEIYLCKMCEKTSSINGFFKMPNVNHDLRGK